MTESICRQARICGACSWLAVPYDEQLERKREALQALFGTRCEVPEVIGMDEPVHFRNKMIVPFAPGKGGRVLYGMYAKGTHRLVSCDDCLINTQRATRIVSDIARMLPSFKIRPYDEDRHTGWLRHVLIREGFKSGEVMVTLVATDDRFPVVKPFIKELRRRHPDITTILLNVNARDTNVVLGEHERNLFGPGWISDQLCGARFKISSRAFYQTNPIQTEKLYDTAIHMADLSSGEVAFDAYCGVGTIGIIAAKDTGCRLIGVESSEDAVRNARANARNNGIEDARFICGDAGEYAEHIATAGARADVVFMDPPRSGSSERFLKQAALLSPDRIVYISCNPNTQVRDIELLEKRGYTLAKLVGVDLFPHTPHVETVVLMSRVKD